MKQTLIAAGLMTLSLPLWAGEPIDSRISAEGIDALTLIVPRGEVTVTGGDHQEIRIHGELDDKAKEWVFEREGNTLIAEVKMPRNWRGDNQGSTLTVTLPSQIEVEASGVSTDFTISKLQGGLELESVSGDLDIQQLKGEIEVDSVSGDIVAAELTGEIELETVSGDIRADGLEGDGSIESVSGDVRVTRAGDRLEVENVSGDIQLQLAQLRNLEATSVSGDIKVEVAKLVDGARLQFETVNGDTELHLPGSASAQFQLETGPGGDIDNRLSDHKPDRGEYVPTESLRFSQGGGSSRVEMKTVNGNLALLPVGGGHLK